MTDEIRSLSWQTNFSASFGSKISGIDNDFLLINDVKVLPAFAFPFRTDVTTFIICLKGVTRGKIGLHSYETQAPCMITLLADEILQHEYISDDFQGLFIVMSKTMTDSLIPHIPKRLPLFQAVRQNPYLPLSNDNFALLLSYYDMLKNVVDMSDNPHRKDIIQHLMIAFHYHSSSWLHMELQDETISETQNENVKQFLKCVEKYYKSQRQVKFYAEELNLTPKYLSQIVKAETGKSVSGWIEEYVILEAKSLLKSSNFTIQQISNELNFIDQSVFGKYFKRNVGISPKQYRQM